MGFLKRTALLIGFGVLVVVIALPALNHFNAGFSADYSVTENSEIFCSNSGIEESEVDLTLITESGESEFYEKMLSPKKSFSIGVKDILSGEFHDASLNIYSNNDNIICNLFDNSERVILPAREGESYIPIKTGLLSDVDSDKTESYVIEKGEFILKNFSDKAAKFTVTVFLGNNSNSYDFEIDARKKETLSIEYENDGIIYIVPEDDNILYEASFVSENYEFLANDSYTDSSFISEGEKILVSNVTGKKIKVTYRTNKTITLLPYQSRIVEKKAGEIVSFSAEDKITVNVIGYNKLYSVTKKNSLVKKSVLTLRDKSELVLVNESEGDDLVKLNFYYLDGAKEQQEIELKPYSSEKYELNSTGYVFISSAIGVKGYLIQRLDGKIAGIISATPYKAKSSNDEMNVLSFDDENTSRVKLKTSSTAHFSGSNVDESDTEEESFEIEDETPESMACLTDGCLETYKDNTKTERRAGISYFNYAPFFLAKPSNAELIINNTSDKDIKFSLESYDLRGVKDTVVKTYTAKAGESISGVLNKGANTMRLYILKPNTTDANYSAYIVVKNTDLSKPWNYQILPSSPLKAKSATFNAKGQLVVSNISDVPALLHYQIVADGKLRFAGDEWFLPKSLRVLDINRQLTNYKDVSATLSFRKYFVPQLCSNNSCEDADEDGYIIASMYADGAHYQVRDESEVSGSLFSTHLTSSDTELEVQNESDAENVVAFSFERGVFVQNFNILLAPFERRKVYLPNYVVNNPDDFKKAIRGSVSNIRIGSEGYINVVYKSAYNSSARIMKHILPYGTYERTALLDETDFKQLKVVCIQYSDADKEGVCDSVETTYAMSTSSVDSDNDGVDDATELYRNLSLPTNATSKVAYQENLTFDDGVKDAITANYFTTSTYRRVTSKEEINGYEVPSSVTTSEPEANGCFSSECLAAFSKNSRKIKGESFVLYSPSLSKMPDTQSKLYLKTYSDKTEKFQVTMYTINGKQSGNVQTISVKPNTVKTIDLLFRDNSQYTYRIVPLNDAVHYSAYVLVRDNSTPYHYQIPALKPLKGRSVSFVPDGKLVVGNVSDVPVMIHYQVLSDGKVSFEGEQWFFAMTQRIIDLGEQLKELENPVMHFDVKRYFAPQKCENEVCKDINTGQLVANIYRDGVVYPLASFKEKASRKLSLRISSKDSYVDLINESSFLNDVSSSIGHLGTLKPNEHKRINLRELTFGDEFSVSYLNIEAKYPISASSKQILSEGARLADIAVSLAEYEPVEDIKANSETPRELEIKCSDNNSDLDNDGACNTIEILFGMNDKKQFSNGRKDTSGNKIIDGVALYKYLFLFGNADGALISYQDLVRDGYVVEEGSTGGNLNSQQTFALSSFGKTVLDKLFLNSVNYKKLTNEELDEEDDAMCQPVKTGIMCGSGENAVCCKGACAGGGYATEQHCCSSGEMPYQKDGEFGCCPSGGMLPQNVLAINGAHHPFTKDGSNEVEEVDDSICCTGGIGYLQQENSKSSDYCGGAVAPLFEAGRKCCGAEFGKENSQTEIVTCGSNIYQNKVCCERDKCGAYEYVSYMGSEDWTALTEQQHCCDSESVSYQNNGEWGCCKEDNLTPPQSYTFYKYSFEGYLKNVIGKDYYSLSDEEKISISKEYDNYLNTQITKAELVNSDNGRYGREENRTCACDNVLDPENPSNSPTTEPSTTGTPIENCEVGYTLFAGNCVTDEECENIPGCGDNPTPLSTPTTEPTTTDSPVISCEVGQVLFGGTCISNEMCRQIVGCNPSQQGCAQGGVADPCSANRPCCNNNACRNGSCQQEEPCNDSNVNCTKDDDCCAGNECEAGRCKPRNPSVNCPDGEKQCGRAGCCPENLCAGEGASAVCCSEEQVVCNGQCCAGICDEGVCKTCKDTITSTNTGEILHCKDNLDGNICGVRHGESENGGCCPSIAYTWCGGGCCLASQCLNPYGAESSVGEEQCCPENTQPCGGISCCAGTCNDGVCTACDNGEVLCNNECCAGECVQNETGEKVCNPTVNTSCEDDPSFNLIGDRCCNDNKYGTLICNAGRVECANFEEGRSCNDCAEGEFLCDNDLMTVPICCAENADFTCSMKVINGQSVPVCHKAAKPSTTVSPIVSVSPSCSAGASCQYDAGEIDGDKSVLCGGIKYCGQDPREVDADLECEGGPNEFCCLSRDALRECRSRYQK